MILTSYEDTYNAMMAKGLAQAESNDSRPLADVIADTKRDIREWTKCGVNEYSN